MDYAAAMHRLRPGAAYHAADNYATLAAAFSDVKRGAAEENARLGYTMPTDAELQTAWATIVAERAAERAAEQSERAQAPAILGKLERGNASAAEVQQALAWLLKRTLRAGIVALLAIAGCASSPPELPRAIDAAQARDEERVDDTRLVGAAAIAAEDELAWQLLERGHQRRLHEAAAKRLADQRAKLEADLRAAAAGEDPAALRAAAQALLDAPRDELVSVAEVEALREQFGDAHAKREATHDEFRARLEAAAGGAPSALRDAIRRALAQLDSTRGAVNALSGAAVDAAGTAIDAAAAKKAADKARRLAEEAAAAKAAEGEGE